MSNLENSTTITTEEQQARQHTFDTVARHLLAQGRKGGQITNSAGNFQCLYRAPDGARCAIGALIPDELLHDTDNTLPVEALILGRNYTGVPVNFRALGYTAHASFLESLQEIHDGFDVEEWPDALTGFAAEYALDASVVINYPAGDATVTQNKYPQDPPA